MSFYHFIYGLKWGRVSKNLTNPLDKQKIEKKETLLNVPFQFISYADIFGMNHTIYMNPMVSEYFQT